MRQMPLIRINAAFIKVHPAAQSRQIFPLTGRLETLALTKKSAALKLTINRVWNTQSTRRFSDEATKTLPAGGDMKQRGERGSRRIPRRERR